MNTGGEHFNGLFHLTFEVRLNTHTLKVDLTFLSLTQSITVNASIYR